MDWSKPIADVKEDEGKKKKQVVGCRSIFVKNLPYDVTEEMIRKEFMVYGTIIKVRMVTWVHTGNFKGFVYIDYSREDSAQIAVNKSGSIFINGRRTIVDYNTGTYKINLMCIFSLIVIFSINIFIFSSRQPKGWV